MRALSNVNQVPTNQLLVLRLNFNSSSPSPSSSSQKSKNSHHLTSSTSSKFLLGISAYPTPSSSSQHSVLPTTMPPPPPPPSSATSTAVLTDNAPLRRRRRSSDSPTSNRAAKGKQGILESAAFMQWGAGDVAAALKAHPFPCLFAASLLFFMGVEYTLFMVPPSAPPFDLGFIATQWLHRLLASSPELNTLLAALNTVFVAMQSAYILWAFLIEGRIRPGLAALYMFTCRGILGYSTQLPLPQEFLGSGADFPVGNVSFFLFFSGHVGGSVIASLDMRRVGRKKMARVFDLLNFLQTVRLLGTRGHYTIDLAVGVGAGVLFDFLAGIYDDSMKTSVSLR